MSAFILASAPELKSDFTKQRPAALSALNSRPRPSGDVSLLQRDAVEGVSLGRSGAEGTWPEARLA